MNCDEIRRLLSAGLDGEIDAARQREVQAHVAECAACQRFGRELGGLSALLHEWPVPEPRPGFADRLMARVASAPAGGPWYREWFEAVRPLTAAAAVVALLCGVTLAYATSTISRSSSEQTTAATTQFAESFDLVPDDSVGGVYLSLIQPTEQ
jgi:anti-sigma factor RsiW